MCVCNGFWREGRGGEAKEGEGGRNVCIVRVRQGVNVVVEILNL